MTGASRAASSATPPHHIMNRNGLLRGTVVRKSAQSAASTRSSTPHASQSAPTTIYGGGVKDASGRTSEYSVRNVFYCPSPKRQSVLVQGRPMSRLQVG
jgi:hypothetical protein